MSFTQPPNMSVQEFYDKASDLSYSLIELLGVDEKQSESTRRAYLTDMLLANLSPNILTNVLMNKHDTPEEILKYAKAKEKALESIKEENPVPSKLELLKERVKELEKQIEEMSLSVDKTTEESFASWSQSDETRNVSSERDNPHPRRNRRRRNRNFNFENTQNYTHNTHGHYEDPMYFGDSWYPNNNSWNGYN